MVRAVPPSSHLPPIKQISGETLQSLNNYINYLRLIYSPEVRGSRRRRKPRENLSTGTITADTITSNDAYLFDHLRSDQFERAYAIRWLTSLVSLLYADEEESTQHNQDKEKTIENSTSLLALCAGSSAAGTVVRNFTFAYQASPDDEQSIIPITIQLTDVSLDNNGFRSVGAQTWGGACLLSELIVEEPHTFGISADQLNSYEHGNFRILELGAGTGLVSMTVGKLLHQVGLDEAHRIEIIATDYDPSVLTNLHSNVQNNFRSEGNSSVSISVHQLDWSSFTSEYAMPMYNEPFDMILGADIVYEPQHASWVHGCVTKLLRKPLDPTSKHPPVPKASFHLVTPLRATHSFESHSVETIFTGNSYSQEPSLQIVTRDTLICDTDTGEEVEYRCFKIGWI